MNRSNTIYRRVCIIVGTHAWNMPPHLEKKRISMHDRLYGPFLLFRHNTAMIRYHLASFVCNDSPQNVVEIVQFILYHHWNSMSFHFL
mmetsp:Transcript_3854/g.5885  ORF Transcript_3854/g.5885 Transcript_3854/m.5885 type:complete len:88 (+) Transcript_3854:49-312(+)